MPPTSDPHPCNRPTGARAGARGARWRLVGLTAATALVTLALWRSAGQAPFAAPGGITGYADRLPRTDPADALAVVAHRVALAGGLWWLLSITLHAGAASLRRPRLLQWSGAWAAPGVRRLVAAAVLTLGATASAAAAPTAFTAVAPTAFAAPAPGPPAPAVVSPVAHGSVRNGRAPAAADASTPPADPVPVPHVPGAPVEPRAPDQPTEVGVVVTVAPGDSLWELTRAAVARETGRGLAAVGDDEVAPRWVRVCAANRDRLQSGDVNVLAPGEAVVIPPA
jgi:nucleoid-associated protein YgaU